MQRLAAVTDQLTRTIAEFRSGFWENCEGTYSRSQRDRIAVRIVIYPHGKWGCLCQGTSDPSWIKVRNEVASVHADQRWDVLMWKKAPAVPGLLLTRR